MGIEERLAALEVFNGICSCPCPHHALLSFDVWFAWVALLTFKISMTGLALSGGQDQEDCGLGKYGEEKTVLVAVPRATSKELERKK